MAVLVAFAVLSWLLAGALCGWSRVERENGGRSEFVRSLVLGPVALLATGEWRSAGTAEVRLPEHKTCPACEAEIEFKAMVCGHCGHEYQ